MSADLSARLLLVDAMNVVGSRPTGWWRDRDAAVRGLADRLRAVAVAQHVLLVVDGGPIAGLAAADDEGVTVRYAPRRGPNAADDQIVEIVRAHPDPAGITVVTSDRDLRDTVTMLGTDVLGAGAFLRHLDRMEQAR